METIADGGKDECRLLVAYASRFGSTIEVAQAIAAVLVQEGATVETMHVKSATDLNSYDAVVVGGAIQYDKWMAEAAELVQIHKATLSALPVAYFFTCLTLSKQSQKAERQAMTYGTKLDALVPQVAPVDIGRFAGVLSYSKMPLFMRLLAKGVLSLFGVKEGDYRDWDAINSWARGVYPKLAQDCASSSHRAGDLK
jgi:menaquinone-dependent protoporphyrinogen oxidase